MASSSCKSANMTVHYPMAHLLCQVANVTIHQPLISIVMPVYQVEKYIANSIRSVINQTFSSYEVILVNDGTRDRSIDIAIGILESAKIIYTLINQENSGLSAARNTGIRKSKGKWITCVDPDDVILPDFLERLYGASLKYGADVAFCKFKVLDDMRIFSRSTMRRGDCEVPQRKILLSYLKRRIVLITPALLVRREFIERYDLWFDEKIKYSEDQHFIWRVLLAAKKVAIVRDKLYGYIKRPGSIMTSSNLNKVLTGYEGMKKLKNEIRGSKLLKKYILPRWVFAALNASTRMMSYDEFTELAKKMNYRSYLWQLLFFPDIRIPPLSMIMIINLKLFYQMGRSLK